MIFKDLQKLILNQKSYFIKTNQIIKKIDSNKKKDINNNLKNEDQIKPQSHKTKKKEIKKIPFTEKKINKKQKSKQN